MAEERTDSPFRRTADELPPGERPPSRGAGPVLAEPENEEDGATGTMDVLSDEWLIQKARETYEFSTSYLNANITSTWERNLAHFNNEHAPGTLYRRKGFKRSAVFRPKTRANIKQQEAALANAAFSTLHLVTVAPVNPADPQQVVAAGVHKSLLEHRLSYTMPWFLTVQGAYQSTKNYGLCISHQYWAYREDMDVVPSLNPDGSPERDSEGYALGVEQTTVREDRLGCDLVEPENFRFDPMCDWRNPAGTSPYLIHIMPMYAGEVLELMESDRRKTNQQKWRKYSLAQILGTTREDYDRTRQAREGRERVDPADDKDGNEFTTVWVHRYIVKVDGTDYEFWTCGTELLLTDPERLVDSQPWLQEGERPYVVGFSTVEAFRNYPSGDNEQGAPLQEEINMVANQRLDNVKLVLNKRYYVRRGSQVDLDALIRNTPGGGVMMNDPEKDVVTVNTPDVTGSSYNEQALLGQEYDELVGGFNPAAQQGSSVAGQQMGQATAGAVQDYGIKIFIETWMEPVLRQLQRLIAMYETDEYMLTIAADQAQLMQKLKMERVTDGLMQLGLYVRVDVGMGNTDPMRKVERLVYGTRQVAEMPGMAQRIKAKPVADAVYGALGYRDSSQFVMTDEEWSQFQQENPPGPSEIDVKMRELDIRDKDNAARDERERLKIDSDFEGRMEEILVKQDMKLDELMAQFRDKEGQRQLQRDLKAADVAQKTREMNQKSATGEGI